MDHAPPTPPLPHLGTRQKAVHLPAKVKCFETGLCRRRRERWDTEFGLSGPRPEFDLMPAPKAVSVVATGRQRLSYGVGSPDRSPSQARPYMAAIISMAVLAASACALGPDATPGSAAVTAAPAAFDRGRLVGRWGVASFHADKDRKRTEAEAKAQCSQPYTIKLGPTDGVLMHVADDPTVHELR